MSAGSVLGGIAGRGAGLGRGLGWRWWEQRKEGDDGGQGRVWDRAWTVLD